MTVYWATPTVWPCGHARTRTNTHRVGKAGERCAECRNEISRRSWHKRQAAKREQVMA